MSWDIVLAAKRVGADLLEFPAPEIAEVGSVRKNIKTAAKSVGGKTLWKQLGSENRKTTAKRVIPTKFLSKPSGREELFLQVFLINHVEKFPIPTFRGSF